jgi:hypothetical protein
MNLIKYTDNDEMIPLKFQLSQNFPNPFKEKTKIKYCIAYKTDVELTIFNSERKMVKRFFKKDQDAGTYEVDIYAASLPEGIYFYQIIAGSFLKTREMILKKN